MHRDLVQLFTNWPANRLPRDKVVALAIRPALRMKKPLTEGRRKRWGRRAQDEGRCHLCGETLSGL